MNPKTNKTRAVLHHAKAKRRFTSAVHALRVILFLLPPSSARSRVSPGQLVKPRETDPPEPEHISPAGRARADARGRRAGCRRRRAAGGGRRGPQRGQADVRARACVRVCAGPGCLSLCVCVSVCVCVRACARGLARARVRVSALWAARRARQSITGQVLPGGSATRALPRAHPRARPRRPRPCGPPDGRPRPQGGGPGNLLPRLPWRHPTRSPQVSINLTFSAGWEGRIGAVKGGSFRPLEVFFPTGICGEAGRRERDDDPGARRGAQASASWPEPGCAPGPTHSGFAINCAVQFRKRHRGVQDANQDELRE
ncbi:uncharacterized protein LOC131827966 [Mustela lutreola]|uniref:uncharacterized protein LOC131827966 n=1 Tax=Mustela lutreola TaxID=9666 RepID=UPI002797B571|nr:uncharacterized protein LOC131827966 [Mustela lutreola]